MIAKSADYRWLFHSGCLFRGNATNDDITATLGSAKHFLLAMLLTAWTLVGFAGALNQLVGEWPSGSGPTERDRMVVGRSRYFRRKVRLWLAV